MFSTSWTRTSVLQMQPGSSKSERLHSAGVDPLFHGRESPACKCGTLSRASEGLLRDSEASLPDVKNPMGNLDLISRWLCPQIHCGHWLESRSRSNRGADKRTFRCESDQAYFIDRSGKGKDRQREQQNAQWKI